MRPLFTLLLIAVFTSTALQAQNWGWGKTIRGDGNVIEQTRSLSGFDGVKACCNMKVEITPGDQFSVVVKAESNLQEYIETKIAGKTLEIGFKNNSSLKPKESIEVYITMPELYNVDASSNADIFTTATFQGERLRLEASSGSAVKVMFAGGSVRADASSGSNIWVKGNADRINAEASSGARVRADEMTAKEASADVSSGANIQINVTERLEADASSGGRIEYRGNPGNVNSDASSGGSVRKG